MTHRSVVKVVCGLGNPGAAYAATRHNVGWWAVEHAQQSWSFTPFERVGAVRVSEGQLGDTTVVLMEPLTYMNRSGNAVAPLLQHVGLDVAHDLLVIVDDAALEVGRIRIRSNGSAGGHNGLKSIEATFATRDYARLRVGVGAPPPGVELADWVLSAFDAEAEQRVIALLPDVTAAVRVWIDEGVDAAANGYNR